MSGKVIERMATVAERWEQFWSAVDDAAVLPWRTDPGDHTADVLAAVGRHLPPELPVIDAGCGDGVLTCWLAGELGRDCVGVDSSPAALAKAAALAGDSPRVVFRQLDLLDAEAVAALAEEVGPAVVWSRFLLHHLQDTAARHAALRSFAVLAGAAGRVVNLEATTLDAQQLSAYAEREPALQQLLQLGVRPGQLVHTEVIQLHQDMGLKIVAFEAGWFSAARSNDSDPRFMVPAEWVVSTV